MSWYDVFYIGSYAADIWDLKHYEAVEVNNGIKFVSGGGSVITIMDVKE